MAFLKPRYKYPMSCFRSCGVFQVLQLKNICFKRNTLPLMSQILCSIRDLLRLIDSAHAWKLPAVCISVSVKGRLRTADCGLRTADCGLWTADCGLWTADCGLQTADCGLRTADYRLRTRGKMQTADWLRVKSRLDKPERVPFSLTYNPAFRSISPIIRKRFHILTSPSLPPPPIAINVFKAAPIEAYRRSSNLRKFFPRNVSNHVTVRPPVRPSALRIPMKNNFGSTNATRSYRDKKSLRHRETTAKKCTKKLSVMQVFC